MTRDQMVEIARTHVERHMKIPDGSLPDEIYDSAYLLASQRLREAGAQWPDVDAIAAKVARDLAEKFAADMSPGKRR